MGSCYSRNEKPSQRQPIQNLTDLIDDDFEPSTLYALIIGNDNYPNRNDWHSLRGPVNDANSFKDYLSGDEGLGVPESNIGLMTNATRKDMKLALKELQAGRLLIGKSNTVQIPEKSTFVLFYAGHGGRSPIPEEWAGYHTTDGLVEQLVPSDIGEVDGSGVVVGIPDRTIAAVLNGLIHNIGDNVIVILDCCHSAGQTRAPGARPVDDSLRLRYLSNLPQLSGSCDEDIAGNQQAEPGLARAMRGGMPNSRGSIGHPDSAANSYILLAACQQDQYACEVDGKGVFTSMLLSILRTERRARLTYASLMLRMTMPDHLQTPSCFGPNQNRIIFDLKEGTRSDDCFIGEFFPRNRDRTSENDPQPVPIVCGGLAHGINRGDKLIVLDISPKQNRIGEAEVIESYATCSKISITPSISPEQDTFYCRLIRDYSKFTIFCDVKDDIDLLSIINTEDVKFSQVTSREKAMAVITNHHRYRGYVQLSFGPGSIVDDNVFSSDVGKRFTELISKEEPSQIRTVLISMFRLYSILRTPKSTPEDWKGIDISFIRVEEDASGGGDLLNHTWISDSETFSHSMKEKGDHISILISHGIYGIPKDNYGLSIINGTNEHLFAYVLRLDPGEMRIDPWHSSTFHTPDVPFYHNSEDVAEVAAGIKPKETCPIGYGNSGVYPVSFSIPDDLKEDCTYFKIILTTSPADFSMFNQTYNPLRPPPVPQATMARSSTARGPLYSQTRLEAVEHAARQQRIIREDTFYYSVNLTVHQAGQEDT